MKEGARRSAPPPDTMQPSVGIVIFLVCLVIFTSSKPSGNPEFTIEPSAEKKLVRNLLRNYKKFGKLGRPVVNGSTPIKVLFGLGLIKMELREKDNMLVLSCWANYKWRDEYLRWNPQKSNITSIRLNYKDVWLPDVMLLNTANTDDAVREVQVIVTHDGNVSWFPHRMFKSSCGMDVRNFPFDNQTCYLWFGSWTHRYYEVDVDLLFSKGIDLSTFKSVYKDLSEWYIVNITAERQVKDLYSILQFKLELKRKIMFSTYILTMPAIFLSFLTLLVFWLPPQDADKSVLGLTIFSSLLLLLLILVESAPSTSSAVPLLGLYYCFTTVLVILSIFLSSVVTKIGSSSENRQKLPKWVQLLFLRFLPYILCMKVNVKSSSNDYVVRAVETYERVAMHETKTRTFPDCDDIQTQNGSISSLIIRLDYRMKRMHDILEEVVKRREEGKEEKNLKAAVNKEWLSLARTLDRLFFFIYLFVIIVSIVIFFPRTILVKDERKYAA